MYLLKFPDHIQGIIDCFDKDMKQFYLDLRFNEEMLNTGGRKIGGIVANVDFLVVYGGYVITKYNGKTRVFDHNNVEQIRVRNKAIKFPSSDQQNNQG